jgi:HD-like signal output (HDOD) protein
MSAEVILDKVESLPALSDNVHNILDICDNPNSSLADLIDAIKQDPLITTNILKAANSPDYGFNQEITDITKAITLFGMISIKGFVVTSFIQGLEEVDLSPYNLDPRSFVNVIQKQNAFVTNWYQSDKETLDSVSMISHLMEIGKILLSQVVIETSSQKLFAYHTDNTSSLLELVQIEKEIFDLSHEEVAAELMRKWGFSPKIYKPLLYISTPDKAPEKFQKQVYILHVVKTIINSHKFNKKQNLEKAIAIVKKHHLKPESFVAAYKKLLQPEVVAA